MKFRSLNEAIESVTNPQPELTQNEYIELLESALESIAEELDWDVDDLDDLLEMAQTPQRKRQLFAKIHKAESQQSYNSPSDRRSMRSTKSGARQLDRADKADKDVKRGRNLFNKEVGSKKLYGRGGRVLKRKIRSTDTTNDQNL